MMYDKRQMASLMWLDDWRQSLADVNCTCLVYSIHPFVFVAG